MHRVAVLGAGAAGLSAARVLAAQGLDVEIFEARDRVGGRAVTDYGIAGHPVEMGAEFIHGENVATWDWIREFGAETTGAAHSYVSWAYTQERVSRPAADRGFVPSIRAYEAVSTSSPPRTG